MNKHTLGALLEEQLSATSDIVNISRWAYQTYLANIRHLDGSIQDILLDLSRMEDSEEFEYSPSELRELAGRLKGENI